jgi:hypothetical protein
VRGCAAAVAINNDLNGLATAAAQPRTPIPAKDTLDALIQSVINPIQVDIEAAPLPTHAPPASFKPGEAIRLWISGSGGTLYYRHLHQGERYVAVPLTKDDAGLVATIPAEYTHSVFPVEYYFVLNSGGTATLHPGFKENFTGTPYFVVMPA